MIFTFVVGVVAIMTLVALLVTLLRGGKAQEFMEAADEFAKHLRPHAVSSDDEVDAEEEEEEEEPAPVEVEPPAVAMVEEEDEEEEQPAPVRTGSMYDRLRERRRSKRNKK